MAASDNVIVGVGKIYVSPVGTALPTENVGAGDYDFTGWTDVGYTKDGVEFGYGQDIFEGKVDQELAPVVRMIIGEKVTIKTNLAETTIANINRAISASAIIAEQVVTGMTTLSFGSGSLQEIQVAFCGSGGGPIGEEVQRVFVLYKAMSDAPINIGHKANELTVLSVTWTGMSVSGNAAGDKVACILQATPIT